MTDDTRRPDAPDVHVEPASAEHLRALIDGPDAFRARFGLEVVDGYVEFDGVLEHSLRELERGADPAWGTHLFVDESDAAVVGLGGFKGPPVEGSVEIGYGIAPAYRGRGCATAAARRLVELAAAAGVPTVVAHTLAETNASTRVLTNLGFEQVAELDDPEDGPVWRWERSTA